MLPKISRMRLSRRTKSLDSAKYLYELKVDGFRALARITDGRGELIPAIRSSANQLVCGVAFDLVYMNGNDLRALPLIERKRQLRKRLSWKRSRILYLDHVENDSQLVFEQIVKLDPEEWYASGRVRLIAPRSP